MGKVGLLLGIFRGSSRTLVVVKLLLALLVIAFATTIDSGSKSFTAQIGSAATVPNSLLVTDKGFAVATGSASANGTSCTSPIVFGTQLSRGNNGITSGHMVYTVRVNSTSSAPSTTKFNVTFALGSTTYGPICIQTATPSTDGEIIDCKFDIAATALPVSIYTFKVTISNGF